MFRHRTSILDRPPPTAKHSLVFGNDGGVLSSVRFLRVLRRRDDPKGVPYARNVFLCRCAIRRFRSQDITDSRIVEPRTANSQRKTSPGNLLGEISLPFAGHPVYRSNRSYVFRADIYVTTLRMHLGPTKYAITPVILIARATFA